MSSYDVIVIGGGPAGMMAAGRAVLRGRTVLLLEKNRMLGKKLSITGGGRCNITNAEFDEHAFLAHYGSGGKFFHSAFSQFGTKDTLTFFESKGLPLVIEARKRAFPKSQKAPDVTKTMKKYASQSGVTVRTGVRVCGFVMEGEKIIGVQTTDGEYKAQSFVLASGGKSHQETGATDEGISWLDTLGHTTFAPSPDIVPLQAEEDWVKNASGKTLSFMKITFGSGKQKFSALGKILFTHFGVSGPLILNNSEKVKRLLHHGPVETTIDMYPDTEVGTLRRRVLAVFDEHKNKSLKNVLKEFVPHGMTEAVCEQLDEELQEMKVHSVSKEDRNALADRLKSMPLTITGTMGYEWAVVSDGGVDLREIDMKTMASKLYPNLYLVGDTLHVSRPSGGYSLQLCWSTGWIAGSNV